MTNKEKKVIFTLIGIMAVILIIVVCVKSFNKPKEQVNANTTTTNTTVANEEKYVTQLESGVKLNNSTSLSTAKTYKTIEISNPQFTSQNGSSVLLADLKNTGSSEFVGEEVTLVLLGDNNEVLKEIPTAIPSVAAGETKKWNVILTADVVNAKDFRVEAR